MKNNSIFHGQYRVFLDIHPENRYDMVYVDFPKISDEKKYWDSDWKENMDLDDYKEWIIEQITILNNILTENGIMFIHDVPNKLFELSEIIQPNIPIIQIISFVNPDKKKEMEKSNKAYSPEYEVYICSHSEKKKLNFQLLLVGLVGGINIGKPSLIIDALRNEYTFKNAFIPFGGLGRELLILKNWDIPFDVCELDFRTFRALNFVLR